MLFWIDNKIKIFLFSVLDKGQISAYFRHKLPVLFYFIRNYSIPPYSGGSISKRNHARYGSTRIWRKAISRPRQVRVHHRSHLRDAQIDLWNIRNVNNWMINYLCYIRWETLWNVNCILSNSNGIILDYYRPWVVYKSYI